MNKLVETLRSGCTAVGMNSRRKKYLFSEKYSFNNVVNNDAFIGNNLLCTNVYNIFYHKSYYMNV